MSQHRLAADNRCPACAATLDGATGAEGTRPEPGNLSICAYCQALLEFDETLHVRMIRPETLDMLNANPELMAVLRRIQAGLAERQRNRPVQLGAAGSFERD